MNGQLSSDAVMQSLILNILTVQKQMAIQRDAHRVLDQSHRSKIQTQGEDNEELNAKADGLDEYNDQLISERNELRGETAALKRSLYRHRLKLTLINEDNVELRKALDRIDINAEAMAGSNRELVAANKGLKAANKELEDAMLSSGMTYEALEAGYKRLRTRLHTETEKLKRARDRHSSEIRELVKQHQTTMAKTKVSSKPSAKKLVESAVQQLCDDHSHERAEWQGDIEKLEEILSQWRIVALAAQGHSAENLTNFKVSEAVIAEARRKIAQLEGEHTKVVMQLGVWQRHAQDVQGKATTKLNHLEGLIDKSITEQGGV